MNRLVKWSLVLVLVLLLTPTALANVTLRALMEDVGDPDY